MLGAGHLQTRQHRVRVELGGDTTVGHRQGQAMLARQHGHRRAAGQEIQHHLPCHLGRKGRHATRRQTVVGGKHHQLRCVQRGPVAAQRNGQLHGQGLDAAQGSQRLGLGIERGLHTPTEGVGVRGGQGQGGREVGCHGSVLQG
jgi:hypothetical protein